MRKFCRHHPHLHATSWFLKISNFVEFDVLISENEASLVSDSNKFDSFIFYFHISMKDISLFESFEFILFFEVDTLVFVGNSENFFFRKRGKNLIQVSIYDFSSFYDSRKL